MEEELRLPPMWLRKSLQGLAFWVGHRCSIYSGWELSEGALVAELCNLMHAHLRDSYSLRCEQPFKKFVPHDFSSDKIGKRARVDISVWERATKQNGRKEWIPKFAIEVKRAKAPENKINDDLHRLAEIVENTKGVRAVLLVISEGKLPKKYVDPKTGYRVIGVTPINNTNSSYQVIEVARVGVYLKALNRNHYCCAIEVIPNEIYKEAKRDREVAGDDGDESLPLYLQ